MSEVAQSELLIYGNTSAVIVRIKWLPGQRTVWCVSGQAQAERHWAPGVTTTKPDAPSSRRRRKTRV